MTWFHTGDMMGHIMASNSIDCTVVKEPRNKAQHLLQQAICKPPTSLGKKVSHGKVSECGCHDYFNFLHD